jgi:hypothetical protein
VSKNSIPLSAFALLAVLLNCLLFLISVWALIQWPSWQTILFIILVGAYSTINTLTIFDIRRSDIQAKPLLRIMALGINTLLVLLGALYALGSVDTGRISGLEVIGAQKHSAEAAKEVSYAFVSAARGPADACR